MSKQLNRKILMVNQRSSIKQEFKYVEPTIKSVTKPSIFAWANRGKGVQGESYNSSDANGFKQIINRRRKPM